jgi:hypothetical protein
MSIIFEFYLATILLSAVFAGIDFGLDIDFPETENFSYLVSMFFIAAIVTLIPIANIILTLTYAIKSFIKKVNH